MSEDRTHRPYGVHMAFETAQFIYNVLHYLLSKLELKPHMLIKTA